MSWWRTPFLTSIRPLLSLLGTALLVMGGPPARADQFERLDGRTLKRLTAEGGGTEAVPRLTFAEIAAMPSRLADSRSALILARTGQGNLVRLLLLAELRRPAPPVGESPAAMAPAMTDPAQAKAKPKTGEPDPSLEPVAVVVIERLDAFDASDPAQRLATRRDLVLFDGLPIDLDSGQVVPPDSRFGADLVFRAAGPGVPARLEPVGGAKLFTLARPFAPTDDPGAAPRPSPGRLVVPGDFAGRYRLFANGQWSGSLSLRVGERGVVTGEFRSDLQGSTYPVTGQVAADGPGHLRFAVALPRARQEFDGYLFGEGKGAIAGTVSLLERTFGFFAVRDGGRFAPEGADLGPLADPDADRPGRITLDRAADGTTRLDGQDLDLDHLAEALRARVAAAGTNADSPSVWLLIRTEADARLADLEPISRAARTAGISAVRWEVARRPEARE